jgi:hypothetical protein
MNFVEFMISAGALAAQMQSAPYYRGPAVVYVAARLSAGRPAAGLSQATSSTGAARIIPRRGTGADH